KGIWNWYYETYPSKDQTNSENDLSILKCLKLLFLATAAEIDTNKGEDGLLINDTFDTFSALPLGHVEREIYDKIKERQGVLTYFILTREKLARTTVDFPNDWPNVNTNSIDYAINAL